MVRMKFGNRHLYQVPGTQHLFHSERDAQFYCDGHGIDREEIAKYDSKKEYERWLFLQQEERDGKISDLRRQVEYEIIPAKYDRIRTGEKSVRAWLVPMPYGDYMCLTRKEAEKYCKENGIPAKSICCKTRTVPLFKEVCIEKKAVYTADFVYTDKDRNLVVEDVKSDITRKEPDYVLRRKLMLRVHGIRIRET